MLTHTLRSRSGEHERPAPSSATTAVISSAFPPLLSRQPKLPLQPNLHLTCRSLRLVRPIGAPAAGARRFGAATSTRPRALSMTRNARHARTRITIAGANLASGTAAETGAVVEAILGAEAGRTVRMSTNGQGSSRRSERASSLKEEFVARNAFASLCTGLS